MRVNLGKIFEITQRRLDELVRDIEQAFTRVPENAMRTYAVTLNFAAPAAVPGRTTQSVTVDGVEVGDQVLVGAPNAAPAGFMPPVAEVSAANTVLVHWLQISGVAADPDGAGGTYRLDLFRH